MKQIHILGTGTSNKRRQADQQSCSSNVPCRDVHIKLQTHQNLRADRRMWADTTFLQNR